MCTADQSRTKSAVWIAGHASTVHDAFEKTKSGLATLLLLLFVTPNDFSAVEEFLGLCYLQIGFGILSLVM